MKMVLHLLLAITTAWMALAPVQAACCPPRQAQQPSHVTQQFSGDQEVMPCHDDENATHHVSSDDQDSANAQCSGSCDQLCHPPAFAVGVFYELAVPAESMLAIKKSDPTLRAHRQSLLRPPRSIQS